MKTNLELGDGETGTDSVDSNGLSEKEIEETEGHDYEFGKSFETYEDEVGSLEDIEESGEYGKGNHKKKQRKLAFVPVF